MPSQYTHQLIAEAIFDRLPENVRERLASPAAYALGAQGGDAFFFFWLHGTRRFNLGRRMHCRGIYRDFCALAAAEGAWQRSYAAGYICHYVADTVFHPFVYAMCERFSSLCPRAHVKWHAYIESDLDTYFVETREGVSVCEYALPLRRRDVDTKALYPLVRAMSGVEFSEHALRAALRRFFLYVRWFRDEHCRRRHFFVRVERALHTPRLLSCLYRRPDYDRRVLNASGEEWSNPSDPGFVSREDADALFDRAVREGVRLVSMFFICADGGAELPREEFSKQFLTGVSAERAK